MASERRLVVAGTVKTGQEYDGMTVTGLGRSWICRDEDLCAIGRQPGERVMVQYAYSDTPEAAPVKSREAQLAELQADRQMAMRFNSRRGLDRADAAIARLMAEV